MRVLIFYIGYLPGKKYGGPVTSLSNFVELLGDDLDLYIVCCNHDLHERNAYRNIKDGWNLVGKAKVKYLSDSDYCRRTISQIIDETVPDLLYVSSVFNAAQTIPLLFLYKQKNKPLLLAPRGELNPNALSIRTTKKRVYLLFLKLFKRFDCAFFQATSKEEKKCIIQELGADEERVFLLPNIPSLPEQKKAISKVAGEVRICFIGRVVENKNLLIALNAVICSKSNVQFDIYGAIEDEEYWNACSHVIGSSPNHISISYCGVLPNQEINTVYKGYDCLISPTEFENYGHAIAEAMLHDVPVIISEGTTPWDEIKEKKVGYVCPIRSIDSFTKAIDEIGDMDTIEYGRLLFRLREYCKNKIDFGHLKGLYIDTFRKLVDNE